MGGKALIRITLPVCPVCGNACKAPMSSKTSRAYCVGPEDARHEQVAMEPRRFVEDRSGGR